MFGNYSLYSQCGASLTFGTPTSSSDDIEIPIILNNPPADIGGMTITIEFTNDNEVTIDESSTTASLHSTLNGLNYSFTYSTSGSLKEVKLTGAHFSNEFSFTSSSPVLFTLHFSVRAGFCSTVSFPSGSPNRIFHNGGLCDPTAIDTEQFCPSSFTISGLIESDPPLSCSGSTNHGVPDATVVVDNTTISNEAGRDDTGSTPYGTYSISTGIASGDDYRIEPFKDHNLDCGLSSYDVALIHRHVLYNDKLTTPYKRIAGDASNNSIISSYDKHLVPNKLILYQISSDAETVSGKIIKLN